MKYRIANVSNLVHDEVVVEGPFIEVPEVLFWKILTGMVSAAKPDELERFVFFYGMVLEQAVYRNPEGLILEGICFRVTE